MFIGGDGEIINSLCWMWVKPWQRLQIEGMDTNVHMHCMSLTHNYSSSSCDLKWYAGVHHVPLPFEVLRSQFMCCRNYEHWRAVRRDRETDRQTDRGTILEEPTQEKTKDIILNILTLHSNHGKVQVLVWSLKWTKPGWWGALRVSCSEGQWILTWKVLGLLGQIRKF